MKVKSRMKKGFTLLELIVVIVILGILATLGFSQYNKTVERTRQAEAMTVLGELRNAAVAYKLEYGGNYPTDISLLPVSAPTSCASTHYFYYYLHGAHGCNNSEYHAEAVRCTTGGKTPNYSAAYWIEGCYDSGKFNVQSGY